MRTRLWIGVAAFALVAVGIYSWPTPTPPPPVVIAPPVARTTARPPAPRIVERDEAEIVETIVVERPNLFEASEPAVEPAGAMNLIAVSATTPLPPRPEPGVGPRMPYADEEPMPTVRTADLVQETSDEAEEAEAPPETPEPPLPMFDYHSTHPHCPHMVCPHRH